MDVTNYSLIEDMLSINEAQCYKEVKRYVEEFLTADHPFRKGPVCPFVPAALKQNNIEYINLMSSSFDEVLLTIQLLIPAYLKYRENKQSSICSFIFILDDDFPIDDLLIIHHALKPESIKNGVMIGATYPTNNASSLHKNEFYPLRTPSPCIIFRDLTVHDLIFLDPAQYSIDERIIFLSSFINKFGKHKAPMHIEQVAIAQKLLNQYKG
ncbi:DUF6875 domain-containing protein [Methylophaga thalassica]|uniref:DUF6875 domain-containing protein n=1 Tax=Methylophaga thalassica TaxID=40223 RepID=UPI002E7B6643|nr:hypothetical protein [Methylophaga thalassica]WVI83886.1 hypothetical protein VSX76_00620 [Methylophaga thalassica]